LLKENKSTRSSIKNFHLLFVNDVVVIRTITFYTTNTHIVYAIYVNGGKIGVSISARREEKREMEEKRERERKDYNTIATTSTPFCHHSLHFPVLCTEKERCIEQHIRNAEQYNDYHINKRVTRHKRLPLS